MILVLLVSMAQANDDEQLINYIDKLKMRNESRGLFFKPYRQRIHQMVQNNDSLDSKPLQASPNIYQHSPQSYSNNATVYKYSPNKSNQQTPNRDQSTQNKKASRMYRQMNEPIWEHLYNQGLQIQKQLMENHLQKQFQIDSQCTFQPLIRKNGRYPIQMTSNFLERNYLWQENKIQKIVREKQVEVIKGLENCTFKPKLNNYKPKTNKYHHLKPSKSLILVDEKSRKISRSVIEDPHSVLIEKRKQKNTLNKQQVGKIKNIIRNQLKRIEL